MMTLITELTIACLLVKAVYYTCIGFTTGVFVFELIPFYVSRWQKSRKINFSESEHHD